MKAYVFPGQGSQKVGMGEDLFDEFKDLCAIADSILDTSIKDLCLEDVEKSLNLLLMVWVLGNGQQTKHFSILGLEKKKWQLNI